MRWSDDIWLDEHPRVHRTSCTHDNGPSRWVAWRAAKCMHYTTDHYHHAPRSPTCDIDSVATTSTWWRTRKSASHLVARPRQLAKTSLPASPRVSAHAFEDIQPSTTSSKNWSNGERLEHVKRGSSSGWSRPTSRCDGRRRPAESPTGLLDAATLSPSTHARLTSLASNWPTAR